METFQAADVDRYHPEIIGILSRPDGKLPKATEITSIVSVRCEATVNIGMVFASTFINYIKVEVNDQVTLDTNSLLTLKQHFKKRVGLGSGIQIDETEHWILENFFRTAMTEGAESLSRSLFEKGRNTISTLNKIKYDIEEAEKKVSHGQVNRLSNIWENIVNEFKNADAPPPGDAPPPSYSGESAAGESATKADGSGSENKE